MFGLGLSLFQRVFRGGMSYVYDNLKLFFSFRKHQDTPITHASAGSTSFDGTNDYVSIADSDDLDFGTSDFSVSMWVKPTEDISATTGLIYKGADGSSKGYYLRIDSDRKIRWKLNDGSTDVSDATSNTVQNGTWNHLTFVFDRDGNGQVYFDGIVDSDSVSAISGVGDISSTETIEIGRYNTSNVFQGSIANVGIWSRALSASEVQGVMYKKYADLSSAEQVSLVSWYGLDAESLGSELVSNGTFDTDTSGWTANSSTLSVDSARLKVDGSGGGSRRAYQDMTVVVGSTYRYTVDVVSGTSNARLRLGTTSDGSEYFNDTNNATGSYSFEVVATGTTMSVGLMCEAVGDCYFDNVSIKELTLDDSHSTNHGSPVGSTTNATVYGGNAPSKPRILDSAPDVVDNYGTLHSGTALSFDGTNDYVEVNDDGRTDFANQSFTISAWVKFDDVSTHRTIFSYDHTAHSAPHYANHFRLDSDATMTLAWNNGSSAQSIATTATYSANVWYYMVATYTSGSQKIYVDGSIVASGTATDTITYYNQEVWIGQNNFGGYMDGLISSPKIFDVALTEAQIQEMYLNPEQILPTGVASSNLKLWLPLQEGSGTTNYDGSGNNNDGTISGATWVKAETEIAQVGLVRQNKPMVFDGVNDYVSIADSDALSFGDGSDDTALTISGWIKTDDVTNFFLINKGVYNSTGEYEIFVNGSNHLKIHLFDESVADCFIGRRTGDISANENSWTHLCFTYNGNGTNGGISIFINGVRSDTTDDSNGSYVAMENHSQPTLIGKNGASYTDGLISEVAIWDEALTATEVTALYNSGTPLDASADSGNYASSDGLQGYWRNDGDTTWTDRSTNSNHGTVAGSPTSIVLTEGITSGRDSQGFYLKDTDENVLTLNGAEYVEVPDSDVLDNIFENGGTFGMWVYPTIGTSNQALVDKTKHSIDIRNQNLITVNQIFSGTNGQWKSDADTITLNQWQHIVIAYNSSSNANNPIFYINGSSITVNRTITPSGTFTSDVGSTLRFGTENATTDWLLGKMDDIRIYSKVLSATEVTKNYNAGLSKHRN